MELHEPIYKYDDSTTAEDKGVKNETTTYSYPIYYYILGGVLLGYIATKFKGK